jgi:hypothetical protein
MGQHLGDRSGDQLLEGVNFINIVRANFLCKRLFGSFFTYIFTYIRRKKLPK